MKMPFESYLRWEHYATVVLLEIKLRLIRR